MQSRHYHGQRAKSNQKLIAIPTRPPAALRLGGMDPAEDMQPGVYRVSCTGAAVERGRIVINYQVIDGAHTGTSLRQWIPTPEDGEVKPKSRYAQQCAVALGRPLDVGDNVNNPASIFSGRFFSVDVGYRKTEKPRGGKYDETFALRRKDHDDGLRVHAILAREEL